jgi:predicted alpha/beta-fold hydrolase
MMCSEGHSGIMLHNRRQYYFSTSLDEPNEIMEKIRIPTIAARSEDFPLSMHECQPFHHNLQVYRTS